VPYIKLLSFPFFVVSSSCAGSAEDELSEPSPCTFKPLEEDLAVLTCGAVGEEGEEGEELNSACD